MKLVLALLLVIALLVGAVAIYLVATVPSAGAQVRFPLTDSAKQLIGRVPASAETFALIPSPAALQEKLKANPATRDAIETWLARQVLPGPLLLGGADAVLWRAGKETSFAIRFDPVRAFLARLWLMASPNDRAAWEGPILVIESAPSQGAPFPAALESLATALPAGDLLVVQRGGSRDYPPIGRPAVSTASVSQKEIGIVSRAAAEPGERTPATAMSPRFARGAMLAVVFAEPPRVLGDMSRILGTNVSGLVAGGGSVALYDVDRGGLLPRPRGVIVVPDAASKAEDLERVRRVAELVGEVRENGTDTLVAFDTGSVGRYLGEGLEEGPWPANRWAVKIDPARLMPVLHDLADSRGLRFLASRLSRNIRDLDRWAGGLANATAIFAADSEAAGTEELRVRVVSK